MASVVDICNLALAHVGDTAAVADISPPDGSSQAAHCARFYPIARDALLESHAWKFCTRRVTLAAVDVTLYQWQYAYVEPADTLRVLKVLTSADSTTANTHFFETETDDAGRALIRTDVEQAQAVVTFRVTDTTRWSPLFVEALAYLLASHLAGPIIKGEEGRAESRRLLQEARAFRVQAVESDANQRAIDIPHIPAHLAARGLTETVYTADGQIVR